MPCSASSLRVATTSPMTFASCMWWLWPVQKDRPTSVAGGDLDRIDDADDRGVDRTIFHARCHACRAAAHDEHRLTDASIHRINGDQIVAFGFAVRVHRARHE